MIPYTGGVKGAGQCSKKEAVGEASRVKAFRVHAHILYRRKKEVYDDD